VHNHDHTEHGGTKQHAETRAAQRFGIKSFVYHRRRPFHLKRYACGAMVAVSGRVVLWLCNQSCYCLDCLSWCLKECRVYTSQCNTVPEAVAVELRLHAVKPTLLLSYTITMYVKVMHAFSISSWHRPS
jgi:hypothetical protein